MTKISIALCTYNGEKYLKEQLESFLRQTRFPDELVICDDHSTDSTIEIIEDFAGKSPFPVHLFVNEENWGVIKNFEKSISLCQGDIIILSDQDDIWLPPKIQRFEEEFSKDKDIGLVYCDVELVDENLSSLNYSVWDLTNFTRKQQMDFLAGNSLQYLLNAPLVCGCSMAFRSLYKDLIFPIPRNLENVIHDYWITILIGAVSKISPLPEAMVKYRQHSGQQVGLLSLIPDSSKTKTQDNLLKTALNKYSFEQELARLEIIQERLLEYSSKLPNDFQSKALRDLEQRIIHLSAREKIHKRLKRRLPIILRELTSLRYSRYSNGIRSAVKDLLF